MKPLTRLEDEPTSGAIFLQYAYPVDSGITAMID